MKTRLLFFEAGTTTPMDETPMFGENRRTSRTKGKRQKKKRLSFRLLFLCIYILLLFFFFDK